LFSNTLSVGLDVDRDILYTATRGGDPLADDRVYALRNASAAQANQTPDVSLCSPQAAVSPCLNTRLSNPQGIAVDASRDLLYVANGAADPPLPLPPSPDKNLILVFNNAHALNGDAAPVFTISNSLNDPHGLSLDTVNDTLYVANFGDGNILAFPQVSSGSSSPRTIGSSLGNPIGVAIDPQHDRLYVALSNADGPLRLFDQVSAANASSQPSYVVGGTPQFIDLPNFIFKTPSALFFDSPNDILYVTDAAENMLDIFQNATSTFDEAIRKKQTNTEDQNAPFPTRILFGSQTGLNQPTGVAVDPTQ
ncbi:MAG TPA: hypothetical protein VFG95_06190, partial [Nitrospiria bacterium]|nr:hypothetical protein [Nitrospiria bacterium]